MGFFDYVFGTGGGGKTYRFRSLAEAKTALYQDLHDILSETQRAEIMNLLAPFSHSGITYSSVEGGIHRTLRKLREAHRLTALEYERLMAWLREKTAV